MKSRSSLHRNRDTRRKRADKNRSVRGEGHSAVGQPIGQLLYCVVVRRQTERQFGERNRYLIGERIIVTGRWT